MRGRYQRSRLGAGLERLEQRCMLAGDVAVFHNFNDTLYINGDAEANFVVIESTGVQDQIRITGLPTAGGPTTINGQESIVVNLYDYDVIVQQILVDLGDGNDLLFFQEASIQANIAIDTGDGDDDVEFTVSEVRGTVAITGAGVDDLSLDTFHAVDDVSFEVEQVGVADIKDARIFGDLTIASAGNNNAATDWVSVANSDIVGGDITITVDNAGRAWVTDSSADDVTIAALRGGSHDFNVERNDIFGDVTYSTQGGSDQLHLGTNDIAGSVSVTSRGGNDYVTFDQVNIGGSVTVNAGAGADTLYADQGDWGATDIRMGGGNDQVMVFDVNFLATLAIRTEGGNDALLASGVTVAGNANLWGGAGSDTFEVIYGNFGGAFNVLLGNGNDQLTVRQNTVDGSALWDGGGDFDTLVDDGTNVVDGGVTVQNFESFSSLSSRHAVELAIAELFAA